MSVTQEGLEFTRLLRQAGKQFKGGKMGTEIEMDLEKLGLIYTWQNQGEL